jgi:outer membrane protein TolC
MLFPSLAVSYERTTQDFENDSAVLMQASYPLWDLNLGKVKEAQARMNKQKIKLETLKKQVGLEVYEALLDSELADKQVLLQKQALDEADELLRQVTSSYEEGKVSFLEFLENLKTINETRLAYFNSLKDYKTKNAELDRVIQSTPIPGDKK